MTLRFAHAGLPVTQSLGLVPTSTFVTTAFSEVLVTVLLVGAAGLFSGAPYLVTNSGPGPRLKRSMWDRAMDKVTYAAVILVLLVLPFDLYGMVLWFTLLATVSAGRWATPLFRSARTVRQAVWMYIALVMVLASLPAFARQLSNPLNMEVAVAYTPGQPPLRAYLVAIREGTVAFNACGRLLVMPLPRRVDIYDERTSATHARSLIDRLGVRYDLKPKALRHPVKCPP